MPEHWYDIRISESCVDPNPLMVERQGLDNFTRFQTRERCALEIAAYVFKLNHSIYWGNKRVNMKWKFHSYLFLQETGVKSWTSFRNKT